MRREWISYGNKQSADREADSMKNHVKTKTKLSEKNEELCVSIFRNLMRARHLMHQKASGVAANVGLHAAELNVIDILGKFGAIPMGRLAEETFISPSNTTSIVKKLEQIDLVQRKRSDKSDREVTASLTTRGKVIFRKCYPGILADVDEHLGERMTRAEMVTLAGILRKLVS